ncbi:glycosyltransferase family 4 protein [Adhaeribacter sp. BT258]|uniref:Glycosyltransferase family 4 protein n=1 Tax=Adhaeribacter terrigena TaxID=2793070 RepID=A0ABS1C4J5_9BACT|nr:glycosyltransferase family 4 protein [Adhaeribacter terrigena]MBK0404106.1 glycosyltransferase family 4 protein [Adhaeribacter terrigena]
MKVLFITNMYPTSDYIYNGIHVKEQTDYLTSKYNLDSQIYFINGRQSAINYLKSIFSLNLFINKNKFDVIHIHFGLTGLFLLFNPFIYIPTVLTIHGSDISSSKLFGLLPIITKMVTKRVNKVIILNENMYSLLSKYNYKLIQIPCGINIKQFNIKRANNPISFTIGFPGDKRRPEKNFSLFEKIVKELRNTHTNIEIIEFHNFTRQEVIDNLSKLDCLLMTSFREGSPQIVKEAMAAGVPIISTKVGDVEKLLENVENCSVINNFDHTEFLEELLKLYALDYNERITNGYLKLESLSLDQDSVTEAIYSLYQTINK